MPEVVSRFLALVSAVLAGLLAGSMILIDVVLLPFWRGVPPEQFRAWFAEHSGRIRAVMIPLGAGAAALNVASAVVQTAKGPRAGAASVAAAAAAGVVAITVTVNEPMNHRFTDGPLTDAETASLLGRWARWHHLRVALGVLATVGAASALMDRESSS
ncbi:anthrone oxygenase family protein [Modestobacter sp. URMC 112]